MTNREIDRSKLTDFIIKPQTCDKVIPKWTSLTRLQSLWISFQRWRDGRKVRIFIHLLDIESGYSFRLYLCLRIARIYIANTIPLTFGFRARRETREHTHTHTHIHICTNSITVFPIRAKLQTQHGVLSPPLYILCYLARRPPRRRANFCPAILCCSLVLP